MICFLVESGMTRPRYIFTLIPSGAAGIGDAYKKDKVCAVRCKKERCYMKKKEDVGIGNVKYGELLFYYPIKFETSLSFEDLCEKIAESSVFFSDAYQERVLNAMGHSLANMVEEWNEKPSDENGMLLKMQDFERYRSLEGDDDEIFRGNIRLEIEAAEGSFKTYLVNTELEAMQEHVERIKSAEEISRRIYGNRYVNSQDRFLLLPLKVELNNGKEGWLYAVLYVFLNKMGVLKLELPVVDVDTSLLKEANPDRYIQKVSNTWSSESVGEISLDGIKRFYFDSLLQDVKIPIISYENQIQHTVLVDFDFAPKSVNVIPDSVQEEFFRIITAPVPDYPYTSYKKDAQEYLKKYSTGSHGIKSIVKTTGGCLTFVDQGLLDYYTQNYKEQYGMEDLDAMHHMRMCNALAANLQTNTEFALLIILLKKMNQSNDYVKKKMIPRELTKIRKEYRENLIFICELQEGCYGSVSEQTETFEKMMPYYMKQEITDTKLAAIDGMLEDEKKQRIEKFQDFLAVGGLVATLIFGLPAIRETVEVLRHICVFWSDDIPNISIDGLSVALWVTVNLFMVLKLARRPISNSNSG